MGQAELRLHAPVRPEDAAPDRQVWSSPGRPAPLPVPGHHEEGGYTPNPTYQEV
jgi:hypothetical protein